MDGGGAPAEAQARSRLTRANSTLGLDNGAVIRRLSFVVLVALSSALAGCGGSHRPIAESSPAGSALSTDSSSSHPTVAPTSVLPAALPISSSGPTTCTVYDGYATQIIFSSGSLDVRTECLVWSANRLNVGYLWGYERAAAIPASTHVCSLADPRRDLTAMVIEETGFAPVTPAERAKGRSACESIVASGWNARRRNRPANPADLGRRRKAKR